MIKTVPLTPADVALLALQPNLVFFVYPDGRVIVTTQQQPPAVMQPYEPKKNPCKACQG